MKTKLKRKNQKHSSSDILKTYCYENIKKMLRKHLQKRIKFAVLKPTPLQNKGILQTNVF